MLQYQAYFFSVSIILCFTSVFHFESVNSFCLIQHNFPPYSETERKSKKKRPPLLFRLQNSVGSVPETITYDNAHQLKEKLIDSVKKFRALQDRDGDVSVDFGVKGGELNETSRAPQKVDYYSISKDVGDAAAQVLSICDQLSAVSPIEEPTKYLGNRVNGTLAPLNGPWKLLFSNAADASFSKNSTRGSAKAQNIVDGEKGIITNKIDFEVREDGTKPALEQLNVVIKAKAVSKKRVELTFLYAKAVLNKFFFFPLFGRKLKIYIPVPAAFITRIVVFFGNIIRLIKRSTEPAPKVPQAYFDILYLDKDLRIHRTGQDNIFVQVKREWEAASPLI